MTVDRILIRSRGPLNTAWSLYSLVSFRITSSLINWIALNVLGYV